MNVSNKCVYSCFIDGFGLDLEDALGPGKPVESLSEVNLMYGSDGVNEYVFTLYPQTPNPNPNLLMTYQRVEEEEVSLQILYSCLCFDFLLYIIIFYIRLLVHSFLEGGGNFDDSDLFGVSDGDYKPEGGKKRAGGKTSAAPRTLLHFDLLLLFITCFFL